MREPTIARNYAAALFELGERHGETERYGDVMDALADVLRAEPQIRVMLDSPRVPKARKSDILAKALSDLAPERFVRFLAAVIKRGRQGLLDAIAREYLAQVDRKFNRVHAGVTLALEPNEALREAVRKKLSEVVGMDVIPHYRTDPEILGGLIVRVGDRIMDGSLRRKMVALRRKMLGA